MIKLLSPQTISTQDPFLNPGQCFQKASLYDHQLTCRGQASHDNQYATHYTIGAAHYTSRLLNINSLSRDNAGSFPPQSLFTSWYGVGPSLWGQPHRAFLTYTRPTLSLLGFSLSRPPTPSSLYTIYQLRLKGMSEFELKHRKKTPENCRFLKMKTYMKLNAGDWCLFGVNLCAVSAHYVSPHHRLSITISFSKSS